MNLLLRKLRIEGKEFVTSSELKAYCRAMKMDYDIAARYLISRGYLVRIFRGIFYVRTLEELKLGRAKYNYLELVAKGLELKGVRNWYFGLHTALKLNNMTHEHFSVEEVVSDSLFRAKPMAIAGYSFRFVKLSPSLVAFGIVESGSLRHSDPEKTILDFVYIWRYNGLPAEKIIADVSDWASGISPKRLKSHAARYPKTVARIAEAIA